MTTRLQAIQADRMVYAGALLFCVKSLNKLGLSLNIGIQISGTGFTSKVDYIFTKDGKARAVVQVKSLSVLKILIENLLSTHDAFKVKMQTGVATTTEQVINRVCLSYHGPGFTF